MDKKGPKKIFGVLGYPLQTTFSPAMHNAAFEALKMNSIYFPLPVPPDKIKSVVNALSWLSFSGVNVTVPFKKTVAPLMDRLEGEADFLKAVNTIVIQDGKMTGYNTDGAGFIKSLKADASFDPSGKKAVLLGTGGAGEAIAYALAKAGVAKLILIDQVYEKTAALKKKISKIADTIYFLLNTLIKYHSLLRIILQ